MPLRFIPMNSRGILPSWEPTYFLPRHVQRWFSCSRSPALIFFLGGRIVVIVGTSHEATKNPRQIPQQTGNDHQKIIELLPLFGSWVVSFLFCPRPSWRSSRKRNRRLFSETGVMFSYGKTPWEIWMQGTCNKSRADGIPTESHESETKKTHQAPNCKLDGLRVEKVIPNHNFILWLCRNFTRRHLWLKRCAHFHLPAA